MPEPKQDEPLISNETWSLSMMNQLDNTLKEIDQGQTRPGQTKFSEVINWNGLMIKLYGTRKDKADPERINIKPKHGAEKDETVAKLIKQKPFEALALIKNLNQVLDGIDPDYRDYLPKLNGLQLELKSLLVEKKFTPEQFDPALTQVTVGL